MAATAPPPAARTETAANCAAPANVVADMAMAASAVSPAARASTPNDSPNASAAIESGRAARTPARTLERETIRADHHRGCAPRATTSCCARPSPHAIDRGAGRPPVARRAPRELTPRQRLAAALEGRVEVGVALAARPALGRAEQVSNLLEQVSRGCAL